MSPPRAASGGARLAHAAGLLLFASLASADQTNRPVGVLIGMSDHIVLGNVRSVAPGAGPGDQVATIDVTDNLLGPVLRVITLGGSTIDPSLPEFHPGTQVVAFLREPTPNAFVPVHGEHGVHEVQRGAEALSRRLLMTAIARGASLRLADVKDDLKASLPPPPPALIGSVLEELTLRVDTSEAADVVELACNALQDYTAPPQLWAIGRSGRLKLPAAQPCLEQQAGDSARNRALALAAIESLGDLGAASSVPAVQSLLAPLPAPAASSAKAGQESKPGKADPEASEAPTSDPGEVPRPGATDPADSQPASPSTAPDGEREPDTGRAGDPDRRRSDGGVSDAAVLALGKLGDPAAVPDLARIAAEGDDLSLHSTVVHALGLIGGKAAMDALGDIAHKHPNPLIRDQASRTLDRLRKARK